ncbi:predicted protein [Nematostella vectensis]|uniref:Uncharacterized protein n=1 Tax=Nematostella vectensis TaxID=45351 RepID=A7T4B0_NEMVE|nr:predicted protein [Nematostella vectensis]|eukprot:XP_001621303.1 hypothetical protein NEMVEDRAFT_v1g222135 [Nematostella vectensis]
MENLVLNWLKKYPWLAYSKYYNGVFCLACVCFGVQVWAKRYTRWIERIDAMDRIVELLHPVTATLEDVSMNRHKHENTNWNPTSRQDAQSLLNAINFSFIVAIVIVGHILALTKPLTVKLQSKAMDILKAKEELALLISVLTEMSNDIDATHHELYQDAVTIARQVDVQPDMPRVAQRQTHRPNAPPNLLQDYYKINLTRVFLDHVLEQLDSRFKDDVFVCYKGGLFSLRHWLSLRQDRQIFASGQVEIHRKCMETSTRWIERIDAMDRIVELLHPVTATLEDVSMNRHKHENTNWNPTSRQDAQSLLNAINFSFIVAIVIVGHILALTKPLTVKLQSKAMDILKAKEELALLISVLTEMSNDIDATHHELYQDAVTIARQVDVQPDMPRVAQRQTHRPNAPPNLLQDYYKINLTRVFLDHVLEQLDSRFKDDVFVCYKGILIIPSVLIATDDWKPNVLEFCNYYRQDMPNYIGLQAELLL